MSDQIVRVMVVDDRSRSREGLCAWLATYPGVEVVAEARNGREAIGLIEESRPDIVLMDVQMRGMDGLTATRIIKERWPAVKVIVVSLYTSYQIDALVAGADAFISKGDSPDNLWTTMSELI